MPALLDIDLVERVKFIRGPGSAVYGSNAFFSVINVVTRRGREVNGGEIATSLGSYDTYTGRFTLGKKFANGLEVLLSGTTYGSDGVDRIYYREFDAPETNRGIAQDRDGDRAYNLWGSLRWGDFTLQGGYSNRDKDIPTASWGGYFNGLNTTIDSRGFVLGALSVGARAEREATVKAAYLLLQAPARGTRCDRPMKPMFVSGRRFRDLSIRGKVMLVTCAASFVAVLAAAVGLYVFQLRHFRDSYQRELRALAQIMAEHCAPALAFDDAKTVHEVLAPLTAKPEIENATVLGKDGKPIAVFGENEDCPMPMPDDPAGIVDRGDSWTVAQPIVLDDERIGTFFIDADYAGPRAALQRLYLGITAAVLAGSLVLVVLLTMRLQEFIARPIRLLATASEAVARDHDYSVRVASPGHDELGQLTAAFNQMLERTEEQAGALRVAELKFRGLVEQLPAITYQAGLGETCFWTYVSPQIFALLGFTADEWLTSDSLWFEHIHPEDRSIPIAAEAVARHTGKFAAEYRMFTKQGELRWFRDQAVFVPATEGSKDALYGVMMDITEAKAAEARLAELNKQLVDSSRMAGMAEIATGVLHNVGNVLNSVNIAASLTLEKLRTSKVESLGKAAALLAGHEHDLAAWLTADPAGKRLPGYLQKLAEILAEENAAAIVELDRLGKNVEHIKEIVAMQQNYARVTGVLEDLSPERLVEDALQLNAASFAKHGIEIVRDFRPAPPVRVDKHKVLQILINLLRNAKHAVEDAGRSDPRIAVTIGVQDGRSCIAVTDNGVGISPENLMSIFRHGFTTKKHGHGFGLHSGANAAKEMGGALTVESPGLGLGATFTVALPAVSRAVAMNAITPCALHP